MTLSELDIVINRTFFEEVSMEYLQPVRHAAWGRNPPPPPPTRDPVTIIVLFTVYFQPNTERPYINLRLTVCQEYTILKTVHLPAIPRFS